MNLTEYLDEANEKLKNLCGSLPQGTEEYKTAKAACLAVKNSITEWSVIKRQATDFIQCQS